MKFKYKYSKAGPYKVPLVSFVIKNIENNNSLGYRALLDSGASFSVFHSDIAKDLGINLDKIMKQVAFKGIGKAKRSLAGKPYIVDLYVFQKGKIYNFESLVVFSDDIPNDGLPLLGMNGFIDKFKNVIFNNDTHQVILET